MSINRPVIITSDIIDASLADISDTVQLRRAQENKPYTFITSARGVARESVRNGAYHVMNAANTWKGSPEKPVLLSVVDPGVGTKRLPVIIDTTGGTFVGPNNGLAHFLIKNFDVEHAAAIDPKLRELPQDSSATFDGRDLFAPVAAKLSMGEDMRKLGTELQKDDLKLLELLGGEVLESDNFGNLKLYGLLQIFLESRKKFSFNIAEQNGALREETHSAKKVRTFGDAAKNDLVVYPGSSRVNGDQLLEIAVVDGSAAARLNIGVDHRIVPAEMGQ